MGKFLRSMSDFKPGERHRSVRDTCDPKRNGEAIRCPELTATPASAGFIMYRDETHGTL